MAADCGEIKAVFEAIEQFIHYYNYQRRQHRLNCLAPMDYRSLLETA
ncbi:MAG: IS3 family transposase [Faecousia sp.]